MRVNVRRVSAAVATATALASGTVALSAGEASAATYNGVCGSGYSVIDHWDLGAVGTIFLTYSDSTGKNCVVTVRSNPGMKLPMAAAVSLYSSSTWTGHDSGNYTTYAGPVYVSAAGKCISWGGAISEEEYYSYGSHCG